MSLSTPNSLSPKTPNIFLDTTHSSNYCYVSTESGVLDDQIVIPFELLTDLIEKFLI